MSYLGLRDLSASPTPDPATGFYNVFIKNGVLTLRDDAGTEYPIASISLPLDLADGGLGTDASAFDGFVRIASGTASAVKANLAATVAPAVTDDGTAGYAVGSIWVDTVADKVYMCTDAATGAAVWVDLSPIGGGIGGNTGSTDNALLRADGTGGATVQSSLVIVDDSGNLSGAPRITTTDVRAATSAGVTIETNGGSDILMLGAGGGVNATFYGNVSMDTTHKIVSMADPTSAQDAATKNYVDGKFPVGATQGGTGQTTATTGDILYASASNTWARLAIGTAGHVLTVSGGGIPSWSAASGGGVSYAQLSDTKSSGTDGGTASTGSWSTRVLNTEDYDPDNIVTLSSNEFTLGAGDYVIHAYGMSYNSGMVWIRHRLYNVTDAAVIGYGQSIRQDANISINGMVSAYVSLAGSKAIRLEYYAPLSGGGNDLGRALSLAGVDEVYSVVHIWKVG